MKAGYARVSTKEQTVDLQVDAVKKAGCTADNPRKYELQTHSHFQEGQDSSNQRSLA
jgi:DNA invertase Pin-like site-specific DNA recombinase